MGTSKFSAEVRERAVQLVLEQEGLRQVCGCRN